MNQAPDVIIRPVLTEKAMQSEADWTFRVRKSATKTQIRHAIETRFAGVKVRRVRTMTMPGKPKRFGRNMGKRPSYKKAIVTLAEGASFDLFAMEGDEQV
jgi:large subunit ribosomal protein L23